MQPRYLCLFNASTLEVQADQVMTDLRAELTRTLDTDAFTLVSSKTWWTESFSRSGTWETWVWETVLGIDYATRKPQFTSFIICDADLGRANAAIVNKALARPATAVLAWSRRGVIERVTEVLQVDPENWKSGWAYTTTSLGA